MARMKEWGRRIETEACACCEGEHEIGNWPVDCRDSSRDWMPADFLPAYVKVPGESCAVNQYGERLVTLEALVDADSRAVA